MDKADREVKSLCYVCSDECELIYITMHVCIYAVNQTNLSVIRLNRLEITFVQINYKLFAYTRLLSANYISIYNGLCNKILQYVAVVFIICVNNLIACKMKPKIPKPRGSLHQPFRIKFYICRNLM